MGHLVFYDLNSVSNSGTYHGSGVNKKKFFFFLNAIFFLHRFSKNSRFFFSTVFPKTAAKKIEFFFSTVFQNSRFFFQIFVQTGYLFPLTTSKGACTHYLIQRGAAPSLRISRKKGSFFKTSACPRFCKRRVLFVPRYEVWGSKSPYNPQNYTWL